jgi:hypothetical protein
VTWDPTPDEDMGAVNVTGGEAASGQTVKVRANVAIFDLAAGEVGYLPNVAEVAACLSAGLLTTTP